MRNKTSGGASGSGRGSSSGNTNSGGNNTDSVASSGWGGATGVTVLGHSQDRFEDRNHGFTAASAHFCQMMKEI
jgi:hypothetical protein